MKKIAERKIIVGVCIAVGVCLTGIVAAAVFAVQRNPLAKGLANLAEEATALEEEMGKHFWADAVNRIGSGSVQAEYSVNIGGIPALQNVTVGLDGKVRRDMESRLLDTEIELSVANAEIGEASLFGTEDTLYLQVPSIWEGSVIFDTEDLGGQWNESAVRKELQLLTGYELGIDRRIDAELFQSFSIESFSVADFLEENGEALRALYKNTETMKVEKAQRKGILSGEEAESLENYVLENAEGEQIETVCYLVVLPEEELKEIFADRAGDVRLGVYLDGEKRIVRVCTVPGETMATAAGEGEFAVNLTGAEETLDRLELSCRISDGDMDAEQSRYEADHAGEVKPDAYKTADTVDMRFLLTGITGMEGNMTIEKDREETGSYRVECEGNFAGPEDVWELSMEGTIQGERLDTGEKVSLEVENLVVRSQGSVVCRGSGRTVFAPLAEDVQMPAGKECRIGEMNEVEAALFLAECTKNVYSNYGGYLKMMQW